MLWLIEDDDAYRDVIVRVIERANDFTCGGAFKSCEEALNSLDAESAPDVVLMDIGLPGMSGIEGVRQITSVSPGTHVIMVTVFQDDEKVFQAICAGASGYLLKSAKTSEIVEAVHTVLDGGSPINARIARKVLDRFAGMNAPEKDYGLSPREKEILHLLVDGHSMKQMADKAFISYYTVDKHIRHIYDKLEVHTQREAVAKAVKERL